MRRILVVAVALAAGWSAEAQVFGHHPPPSPGASGGQHVDCDMVAANPNSGMDKATCEQMNQAAAAYYGAQNDPSASRPGDEQMSCDDIKAEFMRQQVTAPDSQHVAAAQSATRDYMAKSSELQAEGTAAAAALSAQAMAASAASMANPIAGRAADQVLNREIEATQQMMNAKAKAELMPRARTMYSANGQLIGDATSQLQGNPRLARLVSLANEKHCRGW